MQLSKIVVIYEDNHLLVVNKPAGLATMGAVSGQESMANWAADYLREKYNKPGNVYVGIVSRLDRLVSGVLVLARTSKAASRLSDQIRRRLPDKRYLAIVEANLAEKYGNGGQWIELEHSVRKNEAQQRMQVVDNPTADSKVAQLRFRSIVSTAGTSLVEIDLQTGRKHQIRLQLSAIGAPIVGDRKYGASSAFRKGIGLHAASLTIQHPTLKEQRKFSAETPATWRMAPAPIRDKLAAWNLHDEQP